MSDFDSDSPDPNKPPVPGGPEQDAPGQKPEAPGEPSSDIPLPNPEDLKREADELKKANETECIPLTETDALEEKAATPAAPMGEDDPNAPQTAYEPPKPKEDKTKPKSEAPSKPTTTAAKADAQVEPPKRRRKVIQPAKNVKGAAATSKHGGKKQPASQNTSQIGGLDPLSTIVTRNHFYRDGFRKLMFIALIEAAVIVGMILLLIIYMNNTKPQDRYFATTADGRIMRLIPLNQPNMTRAALMSWVAQAATEVMTFGFHDYQRRLQEASRHFTRRGWESFTTALKQSRVIELIEAAQQVVTSAPRSAPTLKQEGLVGGKYRWVVELPLLVNYRSGTKSRADNLQIKIVVQRVPTLESANGVGIEQWIAR